MTDKMRAWGRCQAPGGPSLDDLCDALAWGELRGADGVVQALVERDSHLGELSAALLGHPIGCGAGACAICADMRAGRWEDVLAATGTPVETLRDAYTLALEAGWLPRLPDAALPTLRRLVPVSAAPVADAYVDPFDP